MERADLYLLDSVGGLSPAESEALRTHLAEGCCVCAGNAAEAAAVVAQLAQLLPPQIPSGQLLDRLMAKANETSPNIDATAIGVVPAGIVSPKIVATGDAVAGRISPTAIDLAELRLRSSLPPRPAGRSIGLWRTALISTAAACVAAAVTTVVFRSQPGEPRVMESRDLRYVSMAGSDSRSRASGRIFWDADHHVWHVYVFDLAPPARGETYQLWMISKTGVIRGAGTFGVDATGTGKLLANVPPDTGPLAAAAITNEPIGGSVRPTGTKLLVGTIN